MLPPTGANARSARPLYYAKRRARRPESRVIPNASLLNKFRSFSPRESFKGGVGGGGGGLQERMVSSDYAHL